MEKRIVRMASINGKGIRKRCRKQEHIYLQARGDTDEEAMKNLNEKVDDLIKLFKEYELSESVYVYDVRLVNYGQYETIEQPLFFQSKEYNCIDVPFKEFVKVA